jgi:hypothetical protein
MFGLRSVGKLQDYTALMVSEVLPEVRTNKRGKQTEVRTVNVRDIQRLALGTSYVDIAQTIHTLFWDERLWLLDKESSRPVPPSLLIDSGGVGEAVADDLQRNLGLGFIRYRSVRGTSETRKAKRNFTVPRTCMFEQLYTAFSDDRIRISPKLKLARALLGELRNLKLEGHEETGYVRVTHREGEHVDLAICLASSNWWACRPPPTRVRAIRDERTAMRLLGYDPDAIKENRGLQLQRQAERARTRARAQADTFQPNPRVGRR